MLGARRAPRTDLHTLLPGATIAPPNGRVKLDADSNRAQITTGAELGEVANSVLSLLAPALTVASQQVLVCRASAGKQSHHDQRVLVVAVRQKREPEMTDALIRSIGGSLLAGALGLAAACAP